ncbi:hypothetical protein QFZ22_004909 [Streptomyces canus]|uniref:Aminotransferase class I/classII domain-containing protein n=1 Tax=Streptomyces canus TaxID=58343 RepID=A0AAW8FGV3_9ACTN|nr:hypothetical protein [Streptomyces canus]
MRPAHRQCGDPQRGLSHDIGTGRPTRRRLGHVGPGAGGGRALGEAVPDVITTDIRPRGEKDGFAFCRALPQRAGVVAIPNAVFYDHREAGAPFVRFAFCKRDDVLHEAAGRLRRLASPGS